MSRADEQRFREVFETSYRDLVAYARRRVPDGDADDLVAETFAIAWRRRDALPDGDAGRLHLYGIARKVLANQRRAERRRTRLLARIGRGVPAASEPVLAADDRVADALAGLSEADREVLRLLAWEGLGHNEIAVVLGITPAAAASRIRRARERLSRRLAVVGAERTTVGGGDR